MALSQITTPPPLRPSQLLIPGGNPTATIAKGLSGSRGAGGRNGSAPGANDDTLNELNKWVQRDRNTWDFQKCVNSCLGR